jgi:hypothetical protein
MVKLTEWLSTGETTPTEKGRLMSKEQLEFYMAYDFAASAAGYDMKFLMPIVLNDKMNMQALQGKRSEEIVEGMKALQMALPLDVGTQPALAQMAARRRRGQTETPTGSDE